MEYTKDWKVTSAAPTIPNTLTIYSEGRRIALIMPNENQEANAYLIAAAPIMNGQLRTGNESLTRVQDIIVEVAKSCSPRHAEMLDVAQSYLCGVIAGNELALAKVGK